MQNFRKTQTSLNLTWSQTPKTGFLVTWPYEAGNIRHDLVSFFSKVQAELMKSSQITPNKKTLFAQ